MRLLEPENTLFYLTKSDGNSLSGLIYIGFIILTIWYALKLNMKPAYAWVLGFLTVLPLMAWLSLAFLGFHKFEESDPFLKGNKFKFSSWMLFYILGYAGFWLIFITSIYLYSIIK